MKTHVRTTIGLVAGAALGGLVSDGLTARAAGACECVEAGFVYRLVGVDSPEGAPDHSALWPSRVHLEEAGAQTHITSYPLDGHDEDESLSDVTGEAP